MTTTTTITATPTKLRSGDWGARVASSSVEPGDLIQINAKSGKTWTATVDRVLWRGDDVAVVSTRQRESNRRPRSGAGAAAPVAGYSSWCTKRVGCGCYDCE